MKYEFVNKIKNLEKENMLLKMSLAHMYTKYGMIEIYTDDENSRNAYIKEIKELIIAGKI